MGSGRPGGNPDLVKHQWSQTHQPKNKNGRKPSTIKKYIKDNNLNYYDIAALSKYVLPLKKEKLLELSKNPKVPFVVSLFAVAVLKDMTRGNLTNVMQLIDRAVGKPKETHEISGPEGGPILTRNERILRIEQLMEKHNAPDGD